MKPALRLGERDMVFHEDRAGRLRQAECAFTYDPRPLYGCGGPI